MKDYNINPITGIKRNENYKELIKVNPVSGAMTGVGAMATMGKVHSLAKKAAKAVSKDAKVLTGAMAEMKAMKPIIKKSPIK